MNTMIAMTMGLCARNRHQVCGPSDSFPPTCDGCLREALEADAVRYRWLREHWAEMTGLDWREPRPEKLDAHIDAARASDNG